MNKKRYAGLLWTKVEKYDKMDTKGLETVRRDNCLLVRKVTNESNLEKWRKKIAFFGSEDVSTSDRSVPPCISGVQLTSPNRLLSTLDVLGLLAVLLY